MGLILDLSPRTLEKVLYFASYIVLDHGSYRSFSKKQVLSEKEYQEAKEKWGSSVPCRHGCRVHQGASGRAIDLEKESEELKGGAEEVPPARSVRESSSAWRS